MILLMPENRLPTFVSLLRTSFWEVAANGQLTTFYAVQEEDEDDLDVDNDNSLRSIEAKLDRALSDVSHLTVDNLSHSIASGELPLPEQERQLLAAFSETARSDTSKPWSQF